MIWKNKLKHIKIKLILTIKVLQIKLKLMQLKNLKMQKQVVMLHQLKEHNKKLTDLEKWTTIQSLVKLINHLAKNLKKVCRLEAL